MVKAIVFAWIYLLMLADLALFLIAKHFDGKNKDKATKIGFGYIEILSFSNMVTLMGLFIWG